LLVHEQTGEVKVVFDTLIIGAGPAGLTAATYLGRFRRKAAVIDGGDSRARWIPQSHNIPGFAKGVSGAHLLRELRSQAERYGAQIRQGEARSLRQINEGFEIEVRGATLTGRCVLLASGVQDRLPDLNGAADAVKRGLLRICPVCDGYEAIGRSIAVLGDGPRGEREAHFLRTYSDRVSVLQIGDENGPTESGANEATGIEFLRTRLDQMHIEEDHLRWQPPEGPARRFDVIYSALGCVPRCSLATPLGVARDGNGSLLVDEHQQTSVAGLYAAGDLVRGLNQVVVAAAEAAIAVTHIHNRLREP
jgi:thioredoxin reductase (NADPH)